MIAPPGVAALAPWAWREAAEVLVLPPDPGRAAPLRSHSAAALIEALVALTPPAQPDPGLALALLDRPWQGADLNLLRCQADALRRRLVGDQVTYVVNRNLNVSNHCVQHCSFCAFRRDAEQLLTALQQAAPGIHLHAFSPQELLFFAEQDGLPLETVLERLQACGLGSVPGTAAKVLSQRVRQCLCPEKLSARAWVAVVLQVHRRGLASTCTLMAWHIEQPADLVAHLLTLVAVQAAARRRGLPGFSEFVLLPFIGAAAPAALQAAARQLHRPVRQRTTLYGHL